MNTSSQPPSIAVPDGARPVEEVRRRWPWTQGTVWTDRMLTALEQGVKGGVWFSLIDKVWSRSNLRSSWAKVSSNGGAAGVDHQTIGMFERDEDGQLQRLHEELQGGTYVPRPVKRVWIPKPGTTQKRPLGIPTVRDRVVQAALRHVLEPIFERDFAEQSYGFRPGRGCRDALRRVDGLLKAGYTHVVDADLASYFDTIPHGPLLTRIRDKVADGRVLNLIESYLRQGVMEGLALWQPTAGSPQGAVLSPLLSNIYLDPLDHAMARSGYEMVRYADDFVILCRSEQEAQAALACVRQWTTQAGLTLHADKTRIVDVNQQGFDFLGYRFERGSKRPRDKSLGKFKQTIRVKTRRTSGRSLSFIIADVNRTVRGWFAYFKHSHPTTFERLDGWLRMRLRSILRNRQRRRGCGRGADHQRWPNVFFHRQGLYCMSAAHALYRQPGRR